MHPSQQVLALQFLLGLAVVTAWYIGVAYGQKKSLGELASVILLICSGGVSIASLICIIWNCLMK